MSLSVQVSRDVLLNKEFHMVLGDKLFKGTVSHVTHDDKQVCPITHSKSADLPFISFTIIFYCGEYYPDVGAVDELKNLYNQSYIQGLNIVTVDSDYCDIIIFKQEQQNRRLTSANIQMLDECTLLGINNILLDCNAEIWTHTVINHGGW